MKVGEKKKNKTLRKIAIKAYYANLFLVQVFVFPQVKLHQLNAIFVRP